MNYNVIDKRGVLENGAPFLLDEKKPLVLSFSNLSGEYILNAQMRDSLVPKVTKKVTDGTATIDCKALRPGTYFVELLKVEKDVIVEKIICTPFHVDTLATMSRGLIAYPEIDEVIARVAELEKTVEELTKWKKEVAPLIHEHKIIL